MFGDIGHGLVMFLAGLYLVLKEGYFTKRLKSYEEVSLYLELVVFSVFLSHKAA